jgi:4-amino-4-deoxy-L-arabinose transferase-like glycosyltransferase
MLKSILPALEDTSKSVLMPKSKWLFLLFLVPLLSYILLRAFETELTHLVIPLFPEEPDKSFGFYRDLVRLCSNEMLWLSLFLFVTVALLLYAPLWSLIARVNSQLLERAGFYTTLFIGFTFVASLFIAYNTLQAFANSADEYVYLYQAETLSQGRLWNEAHPLKDFFLYSHIAQKDGISVGRFPPGWPLLLSIPFAVGFPPGMLNPFLALITLALFYRFSKKHYGKRVAVWAVLSLALTSFFIFNAASFFSHIACLLFVLAFMYFLYLHLEKRTVAYALLAGAFLGWTAITRYYSAVLIFIPVVAFLFYEYKWKSLRTFLLLGAGALPFLIFLFWYNYKITGDGFLAVTVWTDAREGLGFGIRGYTPVEGIEHFVRRVLMFCYWCSPGLLILYLIFIFQKIRSAERFLRPEDYFVLTLIVGYYFYYHIGGNQYGPRFWLEGLPFMIIFVVRRVLDSAARWPMALFVAGVIYGIVKMPFIMQREHRIVSERVDLYKVVEEANVDNAVILVTTHTGVMRPMGMLDLTRNGITWDGDVIYALDKGPENRELFQYYPARSFYRYVRDHEIVEGELIRLK